MIVFCSMIAAMTAAHLIWLWTISTSTPSCS